MIVKRWHVVPLVAKNVEFVLLERAKSRKNNGLAGSAGSAGPSWQ